MEEITAPILNFQPMDDLKVVLNPDTGVATILIPTPHMTLAIPIDDNQLRGLGVQITQFFEGLGKNPLLRNKPDTAQ